MATTLSQEALDRLRRSAREGRLQLPIQILIQASDLNPPAGEEILVEWLVEDYDGKVDLYIDGALSQKDVPTAGAAQVTVGLEPLRVEIHAEGMIGMVRITPRIEIPRIQRFTLSTLHGFIDEVVQVSWDVYQVQQTTLLIEGGDEPERLEVPNVGFRTLGPFPPGEYQVSLLASSRHIQYTEDARVESTKQLAIRHRPPQITHFTVTPSPMIFGEPAEISWEVNHADDARLFIDEEDRTTTTKDRITLTPDRIGEVRFHLVASGIGGDIEQSLNVNCIAPPVVAYFEASTNLMELGETMAIEWMVHGAESVRLSFASGTISPIEAVTALIQLTLIDDETITLEAIGFDGHVHRWQHSVSVDVPQIPSIEPELNQLNGRRKKS